MTEAEVIIHILAAAIGVVVGAGAGIKIAEWHFNREERKDR